MCEGGGVEVGDRERWMGMGERERGNGQAGFMGGDHRGWHYYVFGGNAGYQDQNRFFSRVVKIFELTAQQAMARI